MGRSAYELNYKAHRAITTVFTNTSADDLKERVEFVSRLENVAKGLRPHS